MIKGPIKPEHYFHLRDGRVLKSLEELVDALKSIDDYVFGHHITQDRNDFGNWIHHVFKDLDLAERVFRAKTKEEIIDVIESALEDRLDTPEKLLKWEDEEKIEDKAEKEPEIEYEEEKKIEYDEEQQSPKRFDFRQQMSEQFTTVKEAYEKQKEKAPTSSFKIPYEEEAQKEPDVQKPESLDEVVDPEVEKDPDLKKIVKEIKKKKARLDPRKKRSDDEDYPDVSAINKEFVKAYPFEETTPRKVREDTEEKEMIKSGILEEEKIQREILQKEKENLDKIEEILSKERELELREQKILEIEEKLEKEIHEMKTTPKFFSKEFIHGLLIGLLSALIIGLIYLKFWG